MDGVSSRGGKDAADEVLTWLFEEESFAPVGKLVGGQSYSILSDHLGTPLQMHSQQGQQVWATELNSYGQRCQQEGEVRACLFRYQGQYEDAETGLYYNRFRYYDPEAGQYVSQDPIRLLGGNKLYGYVPDTTGWVDAFGLTGIKGCIANPDNQVTAIGKMDDLKKFEDLPNVDTWHKSGRKPGPGEPPVTWAENKAWLDERIDRGDEFWIATDPGSLPPVKGGYIPGKPNGYFTARELKHLNSRGIKPKYKP